MNSDSESKKKSVKLRKKAEEKLKRTPDRGELLSPLETQRLLHELQVHQIELEMQNEELEESRAQLEAGLDRYTELYDFAPVNYFTLLPNGAIREVNLPGARLLGVGRDHLIKTSFGNFVTQETKPFFEAWLNDVFSGKGKKRCVVNLSKKKEKPVSVELEAALSPDGTEARAVLTDITERQALDEQIRRGQKMEIVGQLAGGTAHDFNNILAAMILNLDMLRAKFQLPEEAGTLIYNVQELANRAASLTRQLLVFSERQAMRVEPLEVNAAIIPLIKMIESLPGVEITCERKGNLNELWIEADPSMIDQVVINICLNARDAMPEGGTITVETSVESVATGQIPLDATARPGLFVCLQIRDTGSGMSKKVIEHAFEPFFTTKDIGKGTGLGLACAHSIVRQHGGWIGLESVAGEGTNVKIYLPLSERRKAPPQEAVGSNASRDHKETILFVEDEPSLLQMGSTALSMLGYKVFTAASGPEALELWKKNEGKFDLLLTDMRIPKGVSGLQLAKMLLGFKPSLKIIIMSGYSMEIVKHDGEGAFPYIFLPKPFNLQILTETVRKSLGAQNSARTSPR